MLVAWTKQTRSASSWQSASAIKRRVSAALPVAYRRTLLPDAGTRQGKSSESSQSRAYGVS
jgi:hypothetical protein